MIRISVVITTCNRKYEIARALNSVLSQSRKPDEIIILDNGSTDDTEYYLRLLYQDSFKYIRFNSPLGVAKARNKGISICSGDYVAFLDSDNIWDRNHLFSLEGLLNLKNNECDIVFHRYIKKTLKRNVLIPNLNFKYDNSIINNTIVGIYPDASSALYKISYLRKIRGFNEKAEMHLDWHLILDNINTYVPDITFLDKNNPYTLNDTIYDGYESNECREWENRFCIIAKNKDYIIHNRLLGRVAIMICDYYGYSDYLLKYCNQLIELLGNDMELELVKAFQNSINEMDGIISSIKNDSSQKMYLLMRNWLEKRLSGNTIAEKLFQMGIHSVAIYGAGKHGKLLYKELENSHIQIKCFIDSKVKSLDFCNIPVVSVEDLVPVDAVIVTPFAGRQQICETLTQKLNCKVLCLDDLVL